MVKSNTKSTAIGILGMHRSGTSSIARVVNILGAYVGEYEDLMQPTADNPEGYWEYQQIFLFHERILEALWRTWDTALSLPEDWHLSAEIAPFRDELINLVQARFGKHPVWLWKDPRTSILLPLWKDVLATLGIELRCLLVFRNPLDVARSLERRDGFARNASFGLWLNHNLAMLTNSIGLPRALVSYHGLVADPIASVSRWASNFPLKWSPDDESLRTDLRQAVRADLCHSGSTLEDLRRSGCPAPVLKLARMLNSMENKGNLESPDSIRQIARLCESHATSSKLYGHDFDRSAREKRALKAKRNSLEEQLARARSHMAEQNEWLLERGDLISDIREELRERERQLAKLQSQIEEKSHALAEKDRLLDAAENSKREWETRLTEMRSELAEKDHVLDKRDKLLDAAENSKREWEARLAEMQSELAKKDHALSEMEKLLNATESRSSDWEAQLAKSRLQLAEKDRALYERDKLLTAAEARKTEYEAEIDEARSRLAEMNRELAERDGILNNFQTQIQEQKEQFLQVQEHLAARESDLVILRRSIDRLKTTYSWRITRPLRAALDFFTSIVDRFRRDAQ